MLNIRKIIEDFGIQISHESGNQIYAYCPFHSNKNTPAFTINKNTGLWICFNESCNSKGTLSILAEKLNKNFVEQVRDYTEDEIIKILFPKEKEEIDMDIIKIDYERDLDKIQYLIDRGYSPAILKFFEIGFSEKKNRVVIPVRNENFKAIGFIGRSIDNTDPKYLYTKGFKRAGVLFNLQNAKAYDSVIVVEGSLDAIKVHQSGFPNVVSTLGSNVTDTQTDLLKKNFTKILIFSDQDEAGNGMRRDIMESCPEKDLWIVPYPGDEKDPGELSEDQIRTAIQSSIDYLSWMFDEQNKQ